MWNSPGSFSLSSAGCTDLLARPGSREQGYDAGHGREPKPLKEDAIEFQRLQRQRQTDQSHPGTPANCTKM